MAAGRSGPRRPWGLRFDRWVRVRASFCLLIFSPFHSALEGCCCCCPSAPASQRLGTSAISQKAIKDTARVTENQLTPSRQQNGKLLGGLLAHQRGRQLVVECGDFFLSLERFGVPQPLLSPEPGETWFNYCVFREAVTLVYRRRRFDSLLLFIIRLAFRQRNRNSTSTASQAKACENPNVSDRD
jgi:hypothetical protein